MSTAHRKQNRRKKDTQTRIAKLLSKLRRLVVKSDAPGYGTLDTFEIAGDNANLAVAAAETCIKNYKEGRKIMKRNNNAS